MSVFLVSGPYPGRCHQSPAYCSFPYQRGTNQLIDRTDVLDEILFARLTKRIKDTAKKHTLWQWNFQEFLRRFVDGLHIFIEFLCVLLTLMQFFYGFFCHLPYTLTLMRE